MAQEILNELLSFNVSPKEVIDWLASDDFNDSKWKNFNKNCTKEEFIIFFQNYIRDQFGSALETVSGSKQTPAKRISSQSMSIKNDANFIKDTSILPQQNISLTKCKLASVQSSSSIDLKSNNIMTTPTEHSTSEIDNSSNNQKDVLKNLTAQSLSPQTSTPVIKKRNSLQKKRVELISSSPQTGNINSAFKDSMEQEKINVFDNENISFYNNSFPALGKNNSSSLNGFNTFISTNKNESSNLFNSSLSQKSNSPMSNKILQSPVSPNFSNSILMLSPIDTKPLKRYDNSCNSSSYFQQNISNTPERISSNFSKNKKTTPRQSVSLGDFIVTESRSAKKGNGKKTNSKTVLKNEKHDDNDQQNLSSDTSNTQSQRNSKRKKVNPTPLDVTNERGSNQSTVFETVSRPFTQNPQFVNVSPVEKSVDNESFEVERGLMKIERQKKPENALNENKDISENKVNEQNQATIKILFQTPKKSPQINSVVIPIKTLVDNVETLDILAELYSGFLDHNLVINPMTEIYFIIHLITVQYTNNDMQLPTIVKHRSEKTIDNDVNDSLNSVKKNMSTLRKSLNFDDLIEENADNKVEDNIRNINSCDDLDSSNLTSSLTENLNQVNNKLQAISVHEIVDQNMDDEQEKCTETPNTIKECVKTNLGTPHNCVYFSVQVLSYQKEFIKCLDRVTLKLLCENNQIATFKPELRNYLDTIYSIKVMESNEKKSILNIGTVDLNVCFQTETDNLDKFPSATAFSFFRKQRDMFYEILKIWQDNHLVPGWTFQIALSGKIKNMLTLHCDITNMTHFCRLFKSQMLSSCIQSGCQEDVIDDKTASFLKNLKDNNPEKFTRLQKKLVTPLSQNGPVPLPSFPGIQEFFKDFIMYAYTAIFHVYLENTLIHEIMELSNTEFVGSDIEETETEVDEQTKQSFVICLSSLRLLAKFLGFMTSLPYRSETSMLKDVIASQVIIRSKCLPRIDLQYCLQQALVTGKLSLTVPWIVEYLAMMDHASLRLPYYKKVLEMLYCIYRASNCHNISNSEQLISQKTAILLKLAIGWLFELPVFPTEFYYDYQSKYNKKVLKAICEAQQPVDKIEMNSFVDADASAVSVKHNLFLDKLEMVDDRILYHCCPFLRELNILLTSGNLNVNSISCRHVTPVTYQLQEPVKRTTTKHLEIQLEEAFFHGQPMSTRKTVEYVAERVASSCVKYICNNLLSVERQHNFKTLKKIVEENYKDVDIESDAVKNVLSKDMVALAAKASKNIKEKSKEVIPKMCESRVTQSIMSLLSEDCLDAVKNMCIKIAVRMAMDRIDQWIQSHIVGASHFIKEMQLELNKDFKSVDEKLVNKHLYNVNAPSTADILDNMRNLILDLLETKAMSLTTENLCKLWDQLYQCLMECSNFKSGSEIIIFSLSVDLCLFLITYRNDLFTDEVQRKVFHVWKMNCLKFSDKDSPLSRILSPRNIMLMSRAFNDDVWLNCGKFLKKLLRENILSIDILSDQAVAIFRNEWTTVIMKNLSICLKEAIDGYKSMDEETERIRYLLGWVAGAYNDMDQDSFSFI